MRNPVRKVDVCEDEAHLTRGHASLVPGASEDDIMLEIIIFIGTCVSDPQCAPIFANSQLVAVLYDLMADKQEDDEMVLQIT